MCLRLLPRLCRSVSMSVPMSAFESASASVFAHIFLCSPQLNAMLKTHCNTLPLTDAELNAMLQRVSRCIAQDECLHKYLQCVLQRLLQRVLQCVSLRCVASLLYVSNLALCCAE